MSGVRVFSAGPGRAVGVIALLGWLSCTSETPSPRPTASSSHDKAALYGDAALLPTREGEHVRREVAVASEIKEALEGLPGLQEAYVHVSLAPTAPLAKMDGRGSRVLVRGASIAPPPASMPNPLEDTVFRVVRGIAGPETFVEVVWTPEPPRADDDAPLRGSPPWSLGLALLGLGFSLGLLGDRLYERLPWSAKRRPR